MLTLNWVNHLKVILLCHIVRSNTFLTIFRSTTYNMHAKYELNSIKRTGECLINLGRTHDLCLCRDILWVRRNSEIAYTKTINLFSRSDWSNINLFLFLFHTTHKRITQFGIEQKIHNKKVYNNVIVHCDAIWFTMCIPSNVITHCDVIMSSHCDVILIDLYWTDWSPFGEHIPVCHVKWVHSMK